MSINSFTFAGRLAKDPTLTQTGETKRCFFTLIQNRHQGSDKDSGEKRPEKVISCAFTIFNARAQFLVNNFFKGDQLFVQAHYESWQQEKDGKTEYGGSFIVEDITPGAPSEKRRAKLEAARAEREARQQTGQQAGASGFDDMSDDTDIPF